jgi:molybdopterin-guanine dinucleotide biosynthesis protein
MPILVIGGHSRSVGKTSVVAGLISALPEFCWTALKITQHGHDICSADGKACDCATADHAWAVSEERNRSGESDSSRFLAAGAAHSWWVRTQQGRLAEAMPRVRQILAGAENVIIESNSILRFLKPDLYLTVLDPRTADFKGSAQTFLDRADAVLLHEVEDSANPAWERVSLKPVIDRPTFTIHPPQYVTPEVVDFVRRHLILKAC